jgi:tryptophan-rich sensory protein
MSWVRTAIQIVIACIIPNIGGFLGSLFTATDADSWYGQLEKPVFNPPNWVK